MRARRRRLLLWSAMPVLLVLCVAAKLLSLNVLAGRAASAFESGNSAAVEAVASALGVANAVEPHKAPFAAGDGRALAGDYAAARLFFEEALAVVPGGSPDECMVLVNLSLAIEKLGDQKLDTGDPASADSLYTEALGVVAVAPSGCFTGDSSADSGVRLSEAEERLNQKLDAAAATEAPGDSPRQEAPAEESAQQSQLEKLEESARQAQRERNAGRERDEYLDDTDYGSGTDRPW